MAGTTSDPVDELIELSGKTWRFVDTAGIRRRFRESQGADYYAALRTAGALDRAEVAVVLIDASEPLAEQDLRIVSMVIEAGRALVLAFNKWDMVDEDRRRFLDRELDRQLHTARWAPRVNIVGHDGTAHRPARPGHRDGAGRLGDPGVDGQAERLAQRSGRCDPAAGARRQAAEDHVRHAGGAAPPHFVLFTTGFLEASYRRFIERRLREEFGFEGSPIRVSVRPRDRRTGRPARAGGATR